jgi:hypothetical protein
MWDRDTGIYSGLPASYTTLPSSSAGFDFDFDFDFDPGSEDASRAAR